MKRVFLTLAICLVACAADAQSMVKKGSTNVTRYVMLVDSADGTPETAVTITGIDLQYTRNQSTPATKVDATALAATNTAHTDNYAIAVDATSSPGLYRIDWPDAAFATGADKVVLVVTATGVHPAIEEVQLVDFDPADGVRLGLTALPNAAADAAGGLPISDAGGFDVDNRHPAAAAITNMNIVFNTDFATGYDTTNDMWNVDTEKVNGTDTTGPFDPTSDTVILADNGITAAKIAADAIGASEIAADAIGASEVATDAIGAAELAANSITSSEIADGAIDAGALAADTITAAKIAADSLGASEIATDAFGAAEVAADAGTELGTAAWATTTRQLTGTQTFNVTGNITGNLTGSVGSVGSGGITATSIATDAIGADEIAADAIGASELASNAIGAAEIADSAIDAATLASDAITAAKVAADVTTEILTPLTTTANAELTTAPAANAPITDKIAFIYQTLRNKITVTATEKTYYSDGDAELFDKELSDDGTTYQETEAANAD